MNRRQLTATANRVADALTFSERNIILNALQDKAREARNDVAMILHDLPSIEQAEADGQSLLVTSNGARHIALARDEQHDRLRALAEVFFVSMYGEEDD